MDGVSGDVSGWGPGWVPGGGQKSALVPGEGCRTPENASALEEEGWGGGLGLLT